MHDQHAPLLNPNENESKPFTRSARIETRSIKSVSDAKRKTTKQSFRNKKFTLKILLSSEKAENSPPPNNRMSNAGLKKRIQITRTSFREFRTHLRELPRRTHLHDLERCERHKENRGKWI